MYGYELCVLNRRDGCALAMHDFPWYWLQNALLCRTETHKSQWAFLYAGYFQIICSTKLSTLRNIV